LGHYQEKSESFDIAYFQLLPSVNHNLLWSTSQSYCSMQIASHKFILQRCNIFFTAQRTDINYSSMLVSSKLNSKNDLLVVVWQ